MSVLVQLCLQASRETEAKTAFEGSFTLRAAVRGPVAGLGEGSEAWRNHVITVGPLRPVFSWSWDTFRAMSTSGASITCTKAQRRQHKERDTFPAHPANPMGIDRIDSDYVSVI